MSVELELERTFLAAKLPPELNQAIPIVLEDTYIPEDEDFPVLRLRKKGNKYEITKKIPLKEGDYSGHNEYSINISKNEYQALRKSSKRTLLKKRYKIKVGQHIAEFDVFENELKGLVLVDFEFSDENQMKTFKAPDFCLKDVTQSREILGGQLAGKSYRDIEKWLINQGYKKLL